MNRIQLENILCTEYHAKIVSNKIIFNDLNLAKTAVEWMNSILLFNKLVKN